jgi:putative tricarboxylic transport membrane protein
MLEYSLKQSLIFSKGSFMIFATRPIAATCLAIALLLLLLPLLPRIRGRRPGEKIESDIG